MVQQVHCSRRRLLRRGLEFHVCTINKSAHTKKVWKLIICISYIHIATLDPIRIITYFQRLYFKWSSSNMIYRFSCHSYIYSNANSCPNFNKIIFFSFSIFSILQYMLSLISIKLIWLDFWNWINKSWILLGILCYPLGPVDFQALEYAFPWQLYGLNFFVSHHWPVVLLSASYSLYWFPVLQHSKSLVVFGFPPQSYLKRRKHLTNMKQFDFPFQG